MKSVLVSNLRSRFLAYNDIINSCNEEMLQAKLEVVKNKSLAEHMWCVVGARESYAKAIEKGEWAGFSCSIKQMSKDDITQALEKSSSTVLASIDKACEWNDARNELLLSLSEHEVMHEGQIIRHMYGLGYQIPSSVKWA